MSRALPLALLLAMSCATAPPEAGPHADASTRATSADASTPSAAPRLLEGPDPAPPPPDGAPNADPGTPPAMLRAARFEALDLGGGDRGLLLDGVPAISADGRFVLTVAELDDWGNRAIVVHRARTGRVVRRIDWPRRFDHEEGAPSPIDPVQLRRVRRFLRREGFVALPHLLRGPRKRRRGAEAVSQAFVGDGLRVVVRWPSEEDWRGQLRVVADGRTPATREVEAEEIATVTTDPDGRFVVVASSFCGCHCSTHATVLPLRATASSPAPLEPSRPAALR